MKFLVITPTYNEAGNIIPLLERIKKSVSDAHVLVVDDNSPDGTSELVQDFQKKNSNVFLITRRERDGLAAAYIEALTWALDHDYDHIIQMDADLSHPPECIPLLRGALTTHDLALGCRYETGGGVSGWPWYRKAISRGGNAYAKTVLNLPFKDLTGGFIAWRKELLLKINHRECHSRGYAFLIELKYRAALCHANGCEVAFTFPDRIAGKSKMSPRIIAEAALMVLRLRSKNKELRRQLSKSFPERASTKLKPVRLTT